MDLVILDLVILIVGVVAGLVLKDYLPAYARKKGENLATKEDISEITRKVESIRSDYGLLLEEVRGRNQLRLGALEKRLEVHQQAFTLWKKLHGSVFRPEAMDVVMECQEFWNKNCLYLSPEVREAFLLAYNYAANHKELVDSYRGRFSEGKALIEENWKFISAPSELIFRAVNLPPLTDREIAKIKPPDDEKA